MKHASNLTLFSKPIKLIVADYDANGKSDIAVFHPSTGVWYILRISDGAVQTTQWGSLSDKPQPADYDNDGTADFAIFRPSTSDWWIQNFFGGCKVVHYGTTGDIPVSSPAN